MAEKLSRMLAIIAALLLLAGFLLALPALRARLDGTSKAPLREAVAEALPPALRAAWPALRLALLNSGGAGVRVGCDGWLFPAEEFRPEPGAAAAMRARAAAIGQQVAAWRDQGVAVILAILPAKARVHPALLCGIPYAGEPAARHAEFTALLRAAGVEPLDWLAVLAEAEATGPVWFRTAASWDQRGAALAAAATAEAAASLPLARETGYRILTAPLTAAAPDGLLRRMGLAAAPAALRPAADRYYPQRAEPLTLPPRPEVVLLAGEAVGSANFLGRLQAALRAPVASFAGPEAFGAAGGPAPKLVIWAVEENSLGR